MQPGDNKKSIRKVAISVAFVVGVGLAIGSSTG